MLPAIPDDEEDEESEPQSSASDMRKVSDMPFASQNKTATPTIDSPSISQRAASKAQGTRMTSKHSAKHSISQSSRWYNLPRDVKAYLKYHKDSLSHHHYAFKYDGGDFLKTTFLEIAINDDSQALLFAVVAFAAYHYAVARGDGQISAFLLYYNKSITMLHQSLSDKKRHSVTTLLTILQLATIEVRASLSLFQILSIADTCLGVPGRLGQFTGPPACGTSDLDGSLHTPNNYAR